MRKTTKIKLHYIVETEEDTQSHTIDCATTLGAMNWLNFIMDRSRQGICNLVSAKIESYGDRLLAISFKR
jgi:hypothetical protein